MVVCGQLKRRLPVKQTGCVHTGQQTGGDIAHIAFHAGDLPGEEQIAPLARLQSGAQQMGEAMKVLRCIWP